MPRKPRSLAISGDIGHVHLKVSDLDRAVSFYSLLGLQVKNEIPGATFLAFGSYHHHLALNTRHSLGGLPSADDSTGLSHFALRYQSRRDLALVLDRVLEAGLPIESTSDCGGIADSIYTRDPDGNGVELTWDRPLEQRPIPLPGQDKPLDLTSSWR